MFEHYAFFVIVQQETTDSFSTYKTMLARICDTDDSVDIKHSYVEIPLECKNISSDYTVATAAHLGYARTARGRSCACGFLPGEIVKKIFSYYFILQ